MYTTTLNKQTFFHSYVLRVAFFEVNNPNAIDKQYPTLHY